MAEYDKRKLKPIGQKTIVDQIINTIIDSIIKGNYKAGTKLPSEYELIEEMQVSRNSLREAMKILSTMGIVEIKRGDGTYVCSQVNPSVFDRVVYSMIYDVSTSTELLELRQILDEATVQLAVQKITYSEMEKLQENIDQMKAAIQAQDIERMQKYDMEFHMTLIESCKNVFFIRIMKGVYSIFENSIGENVRTDKIDSLAAVYHQRILNCIKDKNYDDIHAAVEDSLKTWRNRV